MLEKYIETETTDADRLSAEKIVAASEISIKEVYRHGKKGSNRRSLKIQLKHIKKPYPCCVKRMPGRSFQVEIFTKGSNQKDLLDIRQTIVKGMLHS